MSNNPPPYILALDIASNMGVAEGYLGETPKLSSVKLGDSNINHANMAKRADIWFTKKFAEYAKNGIEPLVFIERPIAGFAVKGHTNQKTTEVLIGFYWIAMGRCTAFGAMPKDVAIQTWRVSFLGRGAGRLKREPAKAMSMKIARSLGWNPKNDDESDAAGIFYHAGLQIEPRLMPPVHPLFLYKKAVKEEDIT